MEPKDRPRFGVALAALAATFNRELSGPALEGYWLGMKDLPLDAIELAIARALGECRYMPVPAELRDLAGAGGLSIEARAERAWLAYTAAVNQIGPYLSVEFDDLLTNAAARSLGRWCECDDRPRDSFAHRDFTRAYVALARTGVSGEQAGPLLGIHGHSNRGHNGEGLTADERRMIGLDPVKVSVGLPPLRLPGLARGPLPQAALAAISEASVLVESIGRVP